MAAYVPAKGQGEAFISITVDPNGPNSGDVMEFLEKVALERAKDLGIKDLLHQAIVAKRFNLFMGPAFIVLTGLSSCSGPSTPLN